MSCTQFIVTVFDLTVVVAIKGVIGVAFVKRPMDALGVEITKRKYKKPKGFTQARTLKNANDGVCGVGGKLKGMIPT